MEQTNPLTVQSPPAREKGQSLVEFALVLMFIILPITYVFIDGAITLYTLANVTNAAREGAHAGSIFQTRTTQGGTQTFTDYYQQIDCERLGALPSCANSGSISAGIQSRLGPLVAFSQCKTTVTYDPSTPLMGNPFRELDSVMVRVECPRRLLFGLVNAGTITLTSESTMKIEPGGVYSPTVSLP